MTTHKMVIAQRELDLLLLLRGHVCRVVIIYSHPTMLRNFDARRLAGRQDRSASLGFGFSVYIGASIGRMYQDLPYVVETWPYEVKPLPLPAGYFDPRFSERFDGASNRPLLPECIDDCTDVFFDCRVIIVFPVGAFNPANRQ